jgi:wyosine [tRNA(Phe)-imidazoG37] synthetase (radical SAM superfamily)
VAREKESIDNHTNGEDKSSGIADEPSFSLAFGPVPSRRLGRSIGVNVVPFKACTFSCIYCQLGATSILRTRRMRYFEPEIIASAVQDILHSVREDVDAVTVLGEGEPTLASNLSKIVEELRKIWHGRIALISNGSLFYKREVREGAKDFDVVSVNVSAGDEQVFQKLHRPLKGLTLPKVMGGLRQFRRTYQGELWTETMLVKGVNDGADQLELIRNEIVSIRADRSFLTVPTRPPTLSWVQPPGEDRFREALRILEFAIDVHAPEGESFPVVDDIGVRRLLRVSEMHPLREEQAVNILRCGHQDICARSVLASLVENGELKVSSFRGARYYSRSRSLKTRLGEAKNST